MIKLAAIINMGDIDKLNQGNTNPGDVAAGVKTVLSGALTNYILPTAFFLVIAFGIYGGILYITSYGNEEKATKGKNTFIWAIVGAIIVALAWAIIRFVAIGLLGTPSSTVTNAL